MIDHEEYSYFKKELLKRKTKPYIMANSQLAEELFTRFKLEQPEASIHSLDIQQFICYDKRARKSLAKKLKEQLQRKEKELQELKDLIAEVETEAQT